MVPRRIITLGYHDVVDTSTATDDFLRAAPGHYSLSRASFRSHLEAIQRNGLSVVTLDLTLQNGVTPLFLTFDDGNIGAYDCVAEELERLGWRGHFFITTDWTGRPGFLTPNQIRELRRRGHVIGSHTCSHPSRMSALPWNRLLEEWTRSRSILEDLLGEPVLSASVADGYYSRQVGRSAAAAGFQYLFNSEPVSRVGSEDACQVIGRYAILHDTVAAEAASLAAGRLIPRLRQSALWTAKKAVKTLGGESYLYVRSRVLRRASR